MHDHAKCTQDLHWWHRDLTDRSALGTQDGHCAQTSRGDAVRLLRLLLEGWRNPTRTHCMHGDSTAVPLHACIVCYVARNRPTNLLRLNRNWPCWNWDLSKEKMMQVYQISTLQATTWSLFLLLFGKCSCHSGEKDSQVLCTFLEGLISKVNHLYEHQQHQHG